MAPSYSKVWVSHSSISDFLNCPRLYYLRAIYKDPVTGHKITRMEAPLALGQIVHDVLESLSVLPVEDRFSTPLMKKFETAWEGVSGKKGGFTSKEQEEEYKERGRVMIQKIIDNPGPIKNKAIKIPQELPQYVLSEEDEIILCGKIDWLEYIPDTDSVHIVDFKTGKNEESKGSLQLPIYHLLVTHTQKRPVTKASYWYLYKDENPIEKSLPDLAQAEESVMKIAKRMKLSRQLDHFKCETGGCRYCTPLEMITKGKGELVGTSKYNQDIYIL